MGTLNIRKKKEKDNMISMKTIIPFGLDEEMLKIIKEVNGRIEKGELIHKINEVYKEWIVKERIENLIKNNKIERIGSKIRLKKMKEKLKNDEEVIAQEGDITINMKELKTSLPKLVDELNDVDVLIALKKLMLDIEIRFELLQHTIKPVLEENSKVLSGVKKLCNDNIEVNTKILKCLMEDKKVLEEILNEK